jgi:uncharacterized protein (TIGR02186 family)
MARGIQHFALLCLALLSMQLVFAWPASSTPRLIVDLSENNVEIAYSFSGVNLLLFGAIQGLKPGLEPNIIVVVRGPNAPITMRLKERVAGVWINTRAVGFQTSPRYYTIATSGPIDRIASPRAQAVYELGVSSLHFSPTARSSQSAQEFSQFRAGFVDLHKRLGLFREQIGDVQLIDNSLFRTRITLPARVPIGDFRVEVYLLVNGQVVAQNSQPLRVDKIGFERRLFDFAHESPLLYGLGAVAIALGAGLAAGALVRH